MKQVKLTSSNREKLLAGMRTSWKTETIGGAMAGFVSVMTEMVATPIPALVDSFLQIH